MTDKEKLLALLDEFGVTPAVARGRWKPNGVHLEAGIGEVSGYSGFVTVFDFDADGKFIEVGAWE